MTMIRTAVAALLLSTPAWASPRLGAAPPELPGDTVRTDGGAQPEPGIVLVAGPDGYGFRTTDGAFALRFQGGAEVDGRFYAEPDGGTDTFDMRRLRSDFRATAFRDYEARFQVDYYGTRAELLDAYVNLRASPALELRIGKQKSPVSLERIQGAFTLTFAERAYPSMLAPNRDVGVLVHGAVEGGLAAYSLGVFNGAPDGASTDQDVSDHKDLVGRVFFHPFGSRPGSALSGLGLGVAGSVGGESGTAAAPLLAGPRTPVGRTPILRFYNDGTNAGSVVADGRRTRIAPQGYWYARSLGLFGEYVRSDSRVRRGSQVSPITLSAWQVAASWAITGETRTFRGLRPARQLRDGSWGAWELVARASGLTADREDFPLVLDQSLSRGARTYTGGVNWYLNPFVRVFLNYEWTELGQTAGNVARPTEGVLVSRLQIAF
jgi:phosphate-selective porin OprO and OprP